MYMGLRFRLGFGGLLLLPSFSLLSFFLFRSLFLDELRAGIFDWLVGEVSGACIICSEINTKRRIPVIKMLCMYVCTLIR